MDNADRPAPAPRPHPTPAPRPKPDCSHVKAVADHLRAEGHPEIADFLLRVTGCQG